MTISVNRTQARPAQDYVRQPSPGPQGPGRPVARPASGAVMQQLAEMNQKIGIMAKVILGQRAQISQLMALAGVAPAQQARAPRPPAGTRPGPTAGPRAPGPQASAQASRQTVEAEVVEAEEEDDAQAMRRFAAGGMSAQDLWESGEDD